MSFFLTEMVCMQLSNLGVLRKLGPSQPEERLLDSP
jgi:hypothetical protein